MSSVSWKCTLMYLSIFIDSTRHNVGLFEKSYTSVWEMILNYSFHSLSPFSSILSFWNPHKADVELPKFLPEFSNIFIFFIIQLFFRIFNFCHRIFKTLLIPKISFCSLNVHFYKFVFLSHECNTFFFLWGILIFLCFCLFCFPSQNLCFLQAFFFFCLSGLISFMLEVLLHCLRVLGCRLLIIKNESLKIDGKL